MAPAPAAGRGRAVVRRRRLAVEDAALVLTTEDGRREVLAAPGEITSATWIPSVADRPEALVKETLELGRRGAEPLALPLDDWLAADERAVPRQRGGHALRPLDASGSTAMRIGGATAVAGALGVRLTSGERPSARARVIGASAALRGWHKVLLHGWVAVGVPAFALLVLGVDAPALLVGLVLGVGLLLLTSLTTSLLLSIRAERALDTAVLPAPPWRPTPTVPASRAQVRVALLSAGEDWLVVRNEHGRECWTPGPALGGARTAHVRGSWLAFEDDQETALQRLWWPAWGERARLDEVLAALAARGYEVRRDPDEPTGPLWTPPPRIGDAVTRERDGAPQAFVPGSVAPFVVVLLLAAAGDEALTPRGLALLAPAVLAVGVALVLALRGVRRARDLRPRDPAALGCAAVSDSR